MDILSSLHVVNEFFLSRKNVILNILPCTNFLVNLARVVLFVCLVCRSTGNGWMRSDIPYPGYQGPQRAGSVAGSVRKVAHLFFSLAPSSLRPLVPRENAG